MNTHKDLELSILMPCLNEEETLGTCIQKAQNFLDEKQVVGEIVIADNGSTDNSIEIATKLGARVINIADKGYGNALRGGIAAAQGQFIIMGDSDNSYDFSSLSPFLDQLRNGYDLVMGNRFLGGIDHGAMPTLHKYFGNPILSFIGRCFFKNNIKDFHCGLRGFKKNAMKKIDLQTSGMEFASEMVIKSTIFNLKIVEVATTLSKDGRSKPPHLRSWRDGWRHLRFMLLFSPNWLFLFPGIMCVILGSLITYRLSFGSFTFGKVNFDVQTMMFASSLIIIGFQAFLFAIFTKIFTITEGLLPANTLPSFLFKRFNLESGVVIGLFILLAGLVGSIYAVNLWSVSEFGPLDTQRTIRIIAPSITAIILGTQVVFSSFFMSILGLKRKHNPIQ